MSQLMVDLVSSLLALAIFSPVLMAGALVLSLAFKKPDESWEKPVGHLATASMTLCLGCLLALVCLWFCQPLSRWELPLPGGLLAGRTVFLWDWATAIWGVVCALMGLATIRFSTTYLHREPGYVRFMATALGFLGAMLGSIAADNPVQMAIWWELIGASSLLLIGFYHDRPGPCTGAVAVLRQYRIADSGMLLGCGLLLAFQVHGEFAAAKDLPGEVRALCALGFILAVLVKSAQLPFSGWLPRAMEGPTPSSALFYGGLSLHLGLLLAVRLHTLWDTVFFARAIFIICGLMTAVDAGFRSRIIADAKTSLAWSAMSTIGVLFVLVGLGWWMVVVPLIAGHAIIRWYQLLRAPSMPADLAWFAQSLGLPPARVAPESPAVGTWLAWRSRLAPLAAWVGAGEDFFLNVVRAPTRSYLWVGLAVMPLLTLIACEAQPWSLWSSWVVAIALSSLGMLFIAMSLVSEAEQPLMIAIGNTLAIVLAGRSVQLETMVPWIATVGAAIGLVMGVMLASQRRGAVTALTGATGALGNMAFLAVAGNHGNTLAAALLLIGTGSVATLLLRATYARLEGFHWTSSGGLGLGAPRIHAAFILVFGMLIGMPPWPSFQLIDGAVETASLISPWLALLVSTMWAVLAFRTGKAILEACWGPPRGPVALGPLPDLVPREWSFAVGIPLFLAVVGLSLVFLPAAHDHAPMKASEHHARLSSRLAPGPDKSAPATPPKTIQKERAIMTEEPPS